MVLPNQAFDRLPRSYKDWYPFRICAPSFIYPANWAANIEMLGPYVDEIEILIFDSVRKGDFPTEEEVCQMVTLADEYQLRYNIHLPIDVSLGSPNADCRRHAVDTMIEAVALTKPLNPTAWVLHLSSDESDMVKTEMNRWLKRLEKSVEAIIVSGISGQSLSVENLNYPLEWIRPIIERFDLAVCLDVGHLIGQGTDWTSEYRKWNHRINMVHLQGVRDHRDHCALDALAQSTLSKILATLTSFTGTVSVEVFSFTTLKKSLAYLERYWQDNR